MKVIYDISVLGGALTNSRARTGIFRVVEQTARRLSVHPEVNLSFSAIKNLITSVKYLEKIDNFNNTPLPHAKSVIQVESFKNDLSDLSKQYGFPLKQGIKIVREASNTIYQLLQTLNGKVDRKNLAECDLFHSPYLPLPAEIRSKLRFITVYDLIPILYPQYFEFQEDHLLYSIMKSIDCDTWIFCISEATKNDLLNYHRHIDPEKVTVIPLGASGLFYQCVEESEMFSVRKKYGIPDKPYFLSLSTLEPRKNIDSTIKAFAHIVRQENLNDVSLVLVGAKGWDFDKIFEELAECRDLNDRIIVTGYVEDQDLAAIYSGALAFVYPSYYEGFGLPPLEAMQCGIPVITSNTSSLPEVVGDAGIQVNPNDNDALCQAMLEILGNDEFRQQLAKRSLERAQLFSWEACADVTINHYRKAMNSTQSAM